MLNLLDNINPADVVAYARAVPTPADYLLTQEIVPETPINSVKYRIKTSTRYGAVAAKFRAYDAETPFGRREVDSKVTEGFLPPLGQKLAVGELATILHELNRGADDGTLVDAVYDDAETTTLSIKARMELAAGGLLTDGKFSLVDENGLTLEADFGMDPLFRPTAPVLWSDPTAKILDDEQGWIQFLIDSGDGRPGRVISSSKVVAFLARNLQYQEAFHGRNQTAYPTLTPGQVASVRETYGLPPIIKYDTRIRVAAEANGAVTNQRPLADNLWVYVPAASEQFAETQYGITAEAIVLSTTGNPRLAREEQPGIAVTVREFDDPVKVVTKSSAVAMPVLYAPKSILTAKVLA